MVDALNFDLFVIGGGINGVGIAADSSGRGLKTGLCDQGDLGGGTSSVSTKLIHGGLRYLEMFDFRLVREALIERDVILKVAPHITNTMRFCLPHNPAVRSAWMIRAGLFLYDNLYWNNSLPSSERVYFNIDSPLINEFIKGFEYSDVCVDDARLVILNALQAQLLGCVIKPRCKLVEARYHKGLWRLILQDQVSKKEEVVITKVLVNAAGPWVNQIFIDCMDRIPSRKVRLIKGSHIIVRRIHKENRAYVVQNVDKRIVFVIPYLQKYSLVGTTDVEYQGDPNNAFCSEEEKNYLCTAVSRYFKVSISINDIINSYAGIRSLVDDGAMATRKITRDFVITKEGGGREPILLSVFGGKLTSYRNLSEQVVNCLKEEYREMGPCISKTVVLPGGKGFSSSLSFKNQLSCEYPWIPEELLLRFTNSYGSLAYHFLAKKKSMAEMGENFGHNLTSSEVDYLMDYEWARTVNDIIWRRTKLGLELSKLAKEKLADYMRSKK